jgi:hypothetical protein
MASLMPGIIFKAGKPALAIVIFHQQQITPGFSLRFSEPRLTWL